MTDRHPDIYLEKILTTLQGGDAGDVPTPNWNYEKYLAAILTELKNGAASKEKFIVTLTPTAQDYSGTMDKTVGEITEAYLSGKRIVFYISASGMNVEFPIVDVNKSDSYDYPSFDAVLWNVIDNVFIHVSTSFTDDADKVTYGVITFPMTYDSANGVSF